MIEQTLSYLRHMLLLADAAPNEYVLFGSTVLWMHGLREEVADVDVFVSPRVYGLWKDGPKSFMEAFEERPRADDPPFLNLPTIPPLHAFYEWTARDAGWITAQECFARAEWLSIKRRSVGVTGWDLTWPCIPLDLVRQHKRLAYQHNLGSEIHEKHRRDLVLLDAHLGA